MQRGALQQEIKKRVWEGSMPLRFTLDPTDSIELTSTSSLPEPYNVYYILGHRNEYFPFILKRLKDEWLIPLLSLESSTTLTERDVEPTGEKLEAELGLNFQDFWVEYDGVPLKWHYPIGLLYDLKVQAMPRKISKNLSELDSQLGRFKSSSASINEKTKPWELVLHLRKYPSDKLIKSPSITLFREMFMSLLKETDFVRNGSSKKVMDLPKSDQISLLDGLESSLPSFFQTINRLRGYSEVDWTLHPNLQLPIHISKLPPNIPRAIPVRFYIIDSVTASDDANAIIQTPLSAYYLLNELPQNEERISLSNFKWTTLRDSVYSILCDHKLIPANSKPKNPFDDTPDNVKIIEEALSAWRCIIHGIEPQWGTPLLWLADNFSYVDNFLHIILVDLKTFN